MIDTDSKPRKPAFATPPNLTAQRLEDRLRQVKPAIVCSLTTLLDLRDLDTGEHGTRLAEWAVRVGELLGLGEAELQDVEVASLVHDIGKVGIPDAVLHKPGKLTAEEFEQVKKHPDYGWAILRLLPGFEQASLYVLHHHERMDGTGYPGRLTGERIPLGARIVSVVDVFDALISDRPYRSGWSVRRALSYLEENRGTQFDPRIVELFTSIVQDGLAAGELSSRAA